MISPSNGLYGSGAQADGIVSGDSNGRRPSSLWIGLMSEYARGWMMQPANHECTHTFEEGWVLVRSPVYWSTFENGGCYPFAANCTPDIGRRSYPTRPRHYAGKKCTTCVIYRFDPIGSCEHRFQEGFVFSFTELLWWPGQDEFKPNFWYPFLARSSDGREPEVIFEPPTVVVSISRARRPARRCFCGTLDIYSSQRAAT